MPSSRSPIVGVVILVTAASLFGMLGPLSRFAYDAGMAPIGFTAWRAAIAFGAIAIFVGWRVARRGAHVFRARDLDRRARISLAVSALMGFLLNLGMFAAFDRITVALALLGFYTYPVMVAVASVVLGRESLDRVRIAALVLAVGGMIIVVGAQLDPAQGIRFDALGFGFALGAALSQAVFMIVSRTGYKVVPADQAMGVMMATTLGCSVALALATGGGAGLILPIQQPGVLPVLAVTGIFSAAVPSILFLAGIRLVRGTNAGILMLFEPVVGVALAAWLLAERLSPIQVAGAVAILMAALILQRSDPREGRALAAPGVEADTQAIEPA